jgi:hypothetical protein
MIMKTREQAAPEGHGVGCAEPEAGQFRLGWSPIRPCADFGCLQTIESAF